MLEPRTSPKSPQSRTQRFSDLSHLDGESSGDGPETFSGGGLGPVARAIDERGWPPAPCSSCLALWHCCCPFFESWPLRPPEWVAFSGVRCNGLSVSRRRIR